MEWDECRRGGDYSQIRSSILHKTRKENNKKEEKKHNHLPRFNNRCKLRNVD